MVFPYVRAPGLGSPFHEYDARLPSAFGRLTPPLRPWPWAVSGLWLTLAGVCLLAILLGQLVMKLTGA